MFFYTFLSFNSKKKGFFDEIYDFLRSGFFFLKNILFCDVTETKFFKYTYSTNLVEMKFLEITTKASKHV